MLTTCSLNSGFVSATSRMVLETSWPRARIVDVLELLPVGHRHVQGRPEAVHGQEVHAAVGHDEQGCRGGWLPPLKESALPLLVKGCASLSLSAPPSLVLVSRWIWANVPTPGKTGPRDTGSASRCGYHGAWSPNPSRDSGRAR